MAERKGRNLPPRTNSNSLLDMVRKGLKTKGFIYVTAGNLIFAVLGGLFYLIGARILGVTNYGYISYYLSLGFFMSSLPILGLSSTISTFYPKEGKDALLKESALLTFLLGIIVGVVTALIVIFFPAPVGSNSSNNLLTSIQLLAGGNPYFVSVIPMILGNLQTSLELLVGGNINFVFVIPMILGVVFYTMALARALGRREYKKFFILNSLLRVLEIGLVAVFYLFSARDLEKLMLVAYIAPLFVVSYDYFKDLFSVDRVSFHFAEVRAKMTFTLHTWGMGFAQASRSVLDKIIVGFFFGLLFLGTYNLAFQFLVILLIIPQSLLSYLLPEKSGGSTSREIEILGIVAAAAITILGFLLAPYLIHWLFPGFSDSIPVTQWLSLAVIPASIASIKTSVLLSEERSKIVLGGYVSALAVDILGILLLGQTFQAVGFAWAFFLSQVALMIILWVLPSEKFARLRNRRKSVAQVKKTKS
nr:oligosaccharide flippase family protein [Candidatus Freyarchaeota archaeon]